MTAASYQPSSSRETKFGLIALLFISILLAIFGIIFVAGLLDVNDMWHSIMAKYSKYWWD